MFTESIVPGKMHAQVVHSHLFDFWLNNTFIATVMNNLESRHSRLLVSRDFLGKSHDLFQLMFSEIFIQGVGVGISVNKVSHYFLDCLLTGHCGAIIVIIIGLNEWYEVLYVGEDAEMLSASTTIFSAFYRKWIAADTGADSYYQSKQIFFLH